MGEAYVSSPRRGPQVGQLRWMRIDGSPPHVFSEVITLQAGRIFCVRCCPSSEPESVDLLPRGSCAVLCVRSGLLAFAKGARGGWVAGYCGCHARMTPVAPARAKTGVPPQLDSAGNGSRRRWAVNAREK